MIWYGFRFSCNSFVRRFGEVGFGGIFLDKFLRYPNVAAAYWPNVAASFYKRSLPQLRVLPPFLSAACFYKSSPLLQEFSTSTRVRPELEDEAYKKNELRDDGSKLMMFDCFLYKNIKKTVLKVLSRDSLETGGK